MSEASASPAINPTSRSWTDWPKPDRIALIAGEGTLPVHVAQNAKAMGIEVVPFTISRGNVDALKKAGASAITSIVPGLLKKNLSLIQQAGLQHVVFAGKVNKWILLRDPRLDELALNALKQATRKADDDIMLWLVDNLAAYGLQVLPQTLFLENLFLPAGCLTQQQPTGQLEEDIRYGFELAKEMGRLDVGQTVVVRDGMLIAVEAIEGTDECLKRAGQLSKKKGGVVVKVAKPNQDQRFDVPTVGLRTLNTMKRYGLNVLATEANETLFLEPEAMICFAEKHGIIITSI